MSKNNMNKSNPLLNSANLAWTEPIGVCLAPAAPKIESVSTPQAADETVPEPKPAQQQQQQNSVEYIREQFQNISFQQSSVVGSEQGVYSTNSYYNLASNTTTTQSPLSGTVISSTQVQQQSYNQQSSDAGQSVTPPPSSSLSLSTQAIATGTPSMVSESATNLTALPASSSSSSLSIASGENPIQFQEVDSHWFYQKDPEQPDSWTPFSKYDSTNLEYGLISGWAETTAMIPVNGTRYDVSLRDRTRSPIYWQGPTTKVQRCTWFFKQDSDYRFVPYTEEIANILEYNYRECCLTNSWYRRIDLANSEFVVFYAADSVYHYISDGSANQEGWGSMINETHMTPRYAYRGVHTIGIQTPREETNQPVDHVIFMVHGIGNFCDISFRKLVEVVDDFREVSQELLTSHYSGGTEAGSTQSDEQKLPESGLNSPESPTEPETDTKKKSQNIGRLEVLPISWHSVLHTQQLDSHLKQITLPSIPRMRSFTNDTILDALFYTSTPHAQTILMSVAAELNRIYTLFVSRNPNFNGSIALGGHSLGSLILFDLLNHQSSSPGDYNSQTFPLEQIYFHPKCLFAFGSPIPVFLTVRGVYSLDRDYRLPTCKAFYNIFHPYDPIAYRIEPLIDQEFGKFKPVLIPHHKGRKRFHLELRESITRMGTDIKQKVLTSIRGTIDSIYGFVKSHQAPISEETDDNNQHSDNGQSTTNVQQDLCDNTEQQRQQSSSVSDRNVLSSSATFDDDNDDEIVKNFNFGSLNNGRRIDYVLQERPIEIVNEYLFAIASHGCYWLSEDTALLVLRELYGDLSG